VAFCGIDFPTAARKGDFMEMCKFIGVTIYGFCNGYFGRDSYENKRIEAVGSDWLIARGVDSGTVGAALFNSWEELEIQVNKWSSEEEKERWSE